MEDLVLITGGAGFIGSHLTDELIRHGYAVRILDNLCEQVHGPGGKVPAYLNPQAEFMHGDVCDRKTVVAALNGVDAVVHLAAAVGVGQSMYEIEAYTRINNVGTAVLLESFIDRPVKKLVVASSMSIYGEGLYHTADGEVCADARRRPGHLRQGQWDPVDRQGRALTAVPTPETKPPVLSSVYALSKFDQETMCRMIGRAYGVPVTALRFFNVYGPRQALSNPYTGVLAIFASRLMHDKPPLIYEDGNQQRDFVSVHDVADACRLALAADLDDGVFNIGSGRVYTILEIAGLLAQAMGKAHIQPVVTGKLRTGDIRHCYADISHARRTLDYAPRISLSEGLAEMCAWLMHEQAEDRVADAHMELAIRGLAI